MLTGVKATPSSLLRRPLDDYVLPDEDRTMLAEGVERLEDALRQEPTLTDIGWQRAGKYVSDHVERLAAIRADRIRHPEIAQVAVAPPIILTGSPRSGTTILHSLLAQDRRFRSPLTWETEFPSPPPHGDRLYDDPRIDAWVARQSGNDADFRKDLRDPEVQKRHLIGACLPEECGALLSTALRSPTGPWAGFRVRPWFDWVASTQMAAGYRVHRLWLQHLQLHSRQTHWLLKYPFHLVSLGELAAAYPDARIIQTHRSPEEVISSLASLIGRLRQASFPHIDAAELGREMLDIMGWTLDRALQYRSNLSEDRVIDTSYQALLRDPMQEVQRIYQRLGLVLEQDAEARMRRFLAENPQGKAGRHQHRLEQFSLRAEQVRDRLASYAGRFAEYL